jgi:hypothetical protein
MLLKYLKPGAHEEPGSIAYLLENPTARVVRGNPEIAQWVIDQTPFGLQQRFVSGVINDLASLDSTHDEVLLGELEAMHLARRPQSAMPWCVIEHTDKGKREFHFVIPLFDLLFGKCIHPYVDQVDRNAFRSWVEHFALRYNLDYPHEKLRVKPAFEHLRSLRKWDREFLEEIWNQVHALVQEKRIKTREDLERQLKKDGHKVRFNKHTGGQLQQPVILGPDGNPLRLTNSIYYHPDFGLKDLLPLDRKKKDAVTSRLTELESFLAKWHQFRAFQAISRFFGRKHQKDIAKGEGRKSLMRLKRLMGERIASEKRIDGLAARIDFNSVFRSAGLVKSGFPIDILTPKLKVASAPETSAAGLKASPEAFQPPDAGTNQPPAVAPAAPGEPAKSTTPMNPTIIQAGPQIGE